MCQNSWNCKFHLYCIAVRNYNDRWVFNNIKTFIWLNSGQSVMNTSLLKRPSVQTIEEYLKSGVKPNGVSCN
jgi:hypothetical protein